VTEPIRPLISIIVLCHNYGHFLTEAVDSALAQTYLNCEVLVLDDGSTDDSLEIARSYGEAVRVLTHPNMGVERTGNRGVSEARGEYTAFLSADDVFEPTYVEELYQALVRAPDASFAYCRMRMFGAENRVMRCHPFSPYLLAMRTNFVNGCALTRRADYLAVGGMSDDLGDVALEDWDLWLKMIEHGKRGTYVRKPLLRWRRHTAGSRNPESVARLDRALAGIRERHTELRQALSGPRATVAYALDLTFAAADVALGLSRFPRFLRAFENTSWRRFQRHHLPRFAR
jgi:glycosyltransferase involved in cell wall biosynthesis